jgi:hypothetical protein
MMPDYLYPTQADDHKEWVMEMLMAWRTSGLPYLQFPFMIFTAHTLRESPFWMYMYYREANTDIDFLKGKVKVRIHVIDWSYQLHRRPDAHYVDFGGDETTWFLCDKAEKLRLLSLSDFEHVDPDTGARDGKQLSSTIRSSIAPVVLQNNKVPHAIEDYP